MTEPGSRFDALSVAPCAEDGALLIEFDTAGKPHSKVTQAKHLVTEVADLGELGVGLLGELRLVLEFLAYLGVTAVRASLRDPFERGVPHASGVPERDPGFDVAPVPRIKCAQSQLDVLLRHRPRSIARRCAGASSRPYRDWWPPRRSPHRIAGDSHTSSVYPDAHPANLKAEPGDGSAPRGVGRISPVESPIKRVAAEVVNLADARSVRSLEGPSQSRKLNIPGA